MRQKLYNFPTDTAKNMKFQNFVCSASELKAWNNGCPGGQFQMIRAWSTRHGSQLSESFTREAKHSHNWERERESAKKRENHHVNQRGRSQVRTRPETTRLGAIIDLLVTQKGNAISEQKKCTSLKQQRGFFFSDTRNGILCFMYNPFPTGNVFSFLSYLSLFCCLFSFDKHAQQNLGKGKLTTRRKSYLFSSYNENTRLASETGKRSSTSRV